MNRCMLSWGSLVVLGVAALSSCSERGVDQRVVALFGGEKSVEAISLPNRVEAYRVKDVITQASDVKAIGSYPITAGPVEVDEAAVGELRKALLSADSYGFDMDKACAFKPGTAVRFAGESTTVDVLFCFSCDQLRVHVEGKRIGSVDVDNIRPELVAVMKRVFPEDERIQELKGVQGEQ